MKQIFSKMKESWKNYTTAHPLSSKAIVVAGLFLTTTALMIAGAPILIPLISPDTWFGFLTGIAYLSYGIAACAAVSLTALAAGGGLHLNENKQNKKVETTINEAGQTVQGPHWALTQLDRAQKSITRLSDTFNQSCAPSADIHEKIEETITKTAKAQENVKVLAAGTQGAGADKYQFVRVKKAIELVR